MSDETQEKRLAELRAVDLQEWGDYDRIAALGSRLKMILPNGKDFTPQEAMAVAQYTISIGANPFRGECYAYKDHKGLHFVDGYKLLTRWANKESRYTDRYVPMGEDARLVEGDIGIWCIILRDDRKAKLDEYIAAGASFDVAYEMVTTKAGGVVTKIEQGKRDPPVGWSWLDVARKRALKNALNLSHGMPSMKELAAESWRVDDVETIPEDWQEIPPETSTADAELIAAYNAQERERKANPTNPEQTGPEATNEIYDLHGPPGDQPGGDAGPETTPMVPETWGQFYNMAPTLGFTEDQAMDLAAQWRQADQSVDAAAAWGRLVDAKAVMDGGS